MESVWMGEFLREDDPALEKLTEKGEVPEIERN